MMKLTGDELVNEILLILKKNPPGDDPKVAKLCALAVMAAECGKEKAALETGGLYLPELQE